MIKAMFRLPSLLCVLFLCLILSLILDHTCSSFIPTNNASSSVHSCREDEHAALLVLKHSFTFHDPEIPEEFVNKTRSWKKGTDCCTWDGIRCHPLTHYVTVLDLSNNGLGDVIHSDSSLFKLHHLRTLNLSYNRFASPISPNFGRFYFLKHLDLSYNGFTGKVPFDLAQLSQLKFLDLSENGDLSMLNSQMIIHNFTKLRHLDLSGVSFHSKIPQFFSNLSSLTHLGLGGCNLRGDFPIGVLNLPHLKYLAVGDNDIAVSIFFSSSNNWRSPLEILDLSFANISSTLPPSSGPIQHLKGLSLYNCNLQGTIPAWVWNISEAIDLSHNNLTGNLPPVISTSKLSSLTVLWLGNNMLSGEIPPWMFSLKSLEDIRLENNNFSDTISLYNTLSNLPKLQILHLSNSGLSVTISDCLTNSSSSFPSSLQYLFLSNTNIKGHVPKWFQQLANYSLIFLDISKNSLDGPVQSLLGGNMHYIDVSYNMLYGPLSFPFFSIVQFLAANNNITGSLDASICNLNSLKVMDLSNNLFHGELPHCLGNISSHLEMLNLGGNNFQGTLSTNFSNCDGLNYLDLSSNGLVGLIPKSLTNCINLQLLNLRNNKFKDEFPYWLHTLPSIQVLLLSFNYFHGHISYIKEEHPFSMLRVLDLSNNNFNGKIPTSYIKSFKALMNISLEHAALSYMKSRALVDDEAYYYSIKLDWKGLERKYDKIISSLTLFDLSNNEFEGVIPKGVGQLVSLHALNLSHNRLTGSVPSSMGGLTSLESLDLSSNILSGQIPQELTNVTFLNFFNASKNDFHGPIPQGNNFNTFSVDSYKGNPRLCGFPLPSCGDEGRSRLDPLPNASANNDTRDGGDLLELKVIMMGWASGVVIGMAWGYYMLSMGVGTHTVTE